MFLCNGLFCFYHLFSNNYRFTGSWRDSRNVPHAPIMEFSFKVTFCITVVQYQNIGTMCRYGSVSFYCTWTFLEPGVQVPHSASGDTTLVGGVWHPCYCFLSGPLALQEREASLLLDGGQGSAFSNLLFSDNTLAGQVAGHLVTDWWGWMSDSPVGMGLQDFFLWC